MNDYAVLTKHFETIIDFLRFGISKAEEAKLYYGHGTDNASDDILALILTSLFLPFDVDKAFLTAKLTAAEKTLLAERLSLRIQERIPVPYITKEAYFAGLSFYVNEHVLIPRSPLAELIEQQFSPWVREDHVHQILDLCTGSGCIAIAAAMAFPEASVDAADISKDALEVAAINQEKYHLQERLTLIASNCWDHIPQKRYDVIISNPPYVGREEWESLPEEYHHEPSLALISDKAGLAIVDQILAKAANYLSPKGILIVEVGNSEEALVEAYPDLPFTWLDFEHGGQGVFLLTAEELKTYFG